MFDFENDDASRREKCYTTIAQLPAFVDPKQPPTKKPPFSAIAEHPFIHTVEVTLPEDTYNAVKSPLYDCITKPRYARVFMSPLSLLEGDFFNRYIKTGNILIISEGRSGTDNVFILRNGILKIELGKEWYERTGLSGKPIRSGGRKHAKERYLVELNLRLPSMLHGKKGFERIVWAFKNVLNQSVSWLFYDLATESGQMSDESSPLRAHHPQILDCDPILVDHPRTLVPPLEGISGNGNASEGEMREICDRLCEWLSMVALDSPRSSADDSIDTYLSRYEVPNAEEARTSNLVSLKWHGLISSGWITQLLVLLLKESKSRITASLAWFALASTALGKDAVEGKDGYTILALPLANQSNIATQMDATSATEELSNGTPRSNDNRRFVCWEFIGASMSS